MDKSYLDDIPKDKTWVEHRKDQWVGQENKKGLSSSEIQGPRHRLFKYKDDPKSEIDAYEKYFLNGDIQEFIQESERVSFQDIIFFSPVQSFESMLKVISVTINWLIQNPDKIGSSKNGKLTIEEYLNFIFRYTLSPPYGNYFPDKLFSDMFIWLYGKEYEAVRNIQLSQDDKPFIFKFEIDVEHTCLNLLSGIHDYIWGIDNKESNASYKFLIDYFLSIYPRLNPICYSTELPPRSSFDIDSKITRGHYTHSRWLIASLNGVVTEFDLDDDDELLESLVINDEEAFAKLKDGMAMIKMPNEFYHLEKFVLEHGEDCIYA